MEDEYLDSFMEDQLSGGAEDYNAFEDEQDHEEDSSFDDDSEFED